MLKYRPHRASPYLMAMSKKSVKELRWRISRTKSTPAIEQGTIAKEVQF
jgi:hypothetical protein